MLDVLRQPERLTVASLRTDGGTQPRAGLDEATVAEYTEAITGPNSWPFPPLVAFFDGSHYWLADGFHRLAAAVRFCKQEKIASTSLAVLVDIRQGDRRDAILHSVGANAEHGLRRTNEDKRRAVTRLLHDDEWSQWSDREIARRAKVSDRFVNNLRKELSANRSQMTNTQRTATRNGITYTIDTANIGKAQPAPAPAAQDDKFSYQSRIAAVNLVLNEQPDAAETILDDLRNGRRGWYHDLILCYTDDTDPETWRRVARDIDAVRRPPSAVPPTDNPGLSVDVPAPTPRERRIAEAQSLPPKTYNVILADPPWQYNNTGLNGAAANHYDTMSLTELGGLLWSIGLNIADNAVLFLWVTNPMLEDAFDLINNWGFRYKTNIVWVKDRVGTGFYVRGMHELLLICTRGAMTPIDTNHTPPITSVLKAPTQEHSRKPDQVHDLIERLYPDCNYIELFARRPRPGWDVWGNEVNQ